MAERLANAYTAQENIGGIEASSAGTHAVIGHAMHAHAALVLESLGGDSSSFFARQLTARIASSADLILTMTRSQREAVLELSPHQFGKTYSLGEAQQLVTKCAATSAAEMAASRSALLPEEVLDIPDPIGRDLDIFATVGSQIAQLLFPILESFRPE